MSAIERSVRALSSACGILAIVCLLAACVVVCQMVFVRYVLESSTIWQTEFVLYSVVAATLLGAPQVLKSGGHVSVDLLAQSLGPGARRWQGVLAAVLGFVFVAVMAWSGTRYFLEAWENGWVTESVWAPPLWLVLLPLPVGLGALALQYAVQIFALLLRPETAARGAEPAE